MSLDLCFKMWSEKVKVHPWIGIHYEKPTIFRYKTLILGESNYTTPENFGPDLVNGCVCNDIGDDKPRDTRGFCKFSTKIRRVIFGRDTKIDPKEFWSNVTFYNFVQDRVGDKSKVRPTDQMWIGSVEPFAEVVVKLMPERILVLGKENWSKLLKHFKNTKVDEIKTNLFVDSYNVLAGYIVHPSAGRGFSYEKWQPVAKAIILED